MDEAEWDSVIDVHLKGHFARVPLATAYWRDGSKETGEPVNAKIVNTASESGLYGNAGQANYAAAKAGIASMTIVMARELDRIGVRVNVIGPVGADVLDRRLVARDFMNAEGRRVRPLRARERVGGRRWLASDLRRRDRPGREGHGRPGAARARLAADHRGDRRQAVDDRSIDAVARSARSRSPTRACRRSCRNVERLIRSPGRVAFGRPVAPLRTTRRADRHRPRARRDPARRHRALDAPRSRGHVRQAARRAAGLVPRGAGAAARARLDFPQGPGFWALTRYADVMQVEPPPRHVPLRAGINIGDMPAGDRGVPRLDDQHGRARSTRSCA